MIKVGLFGLFYTSFVLVVKGVHNIKTNAENKERKQKAILKEKETYFDEKGCERLISNNAKVMKATLWNDCIYGKEGDYVLKYVDSNRIARNYTKEERDKTEAKSVSKAKEEGKTVYRLGTWMDDHCKSKIQGYRYKDFKTGATYVIRTFNGVRFYMDIKTGQIVRETDGELIRNKTPDAHHHNIEEYEKLRQKINKDQQAYFEKNGRIDARNGYCKCGGRDWYED